MRVVIADVQAEAMNAAVKELRASGADAIGVLTDVTSAASVEALAEAAERQFGPANLAGIHAYNEDVDIEDVLRSAEIYMLSFCELLGIG